MPLSDSKNIVCLVVDRLHVSYLGAYGNTWIQTPSIDRFAAQSLVFDRAITDSSNLELLYQSLLCGRHAVRSASVSIDAPKQGQNIVNQFNSGGRHTVLLTDDPEISQTQSTAAFAEHIFLELGNAHNSVGDDIDNTQHAQFFLAAIDRLQSMSAPFVLWLHCGALGHAWDAPLEFREQYRDEEDPPPSISADVPNRMLPINVDPDELLSATHAYAGQVTLLDHFVGTFLEALDELRLAQYARGTARAARHFAG